jgi:phosphoglycolate phosphatase-like HAD superfamily hydrolase
MREAIDAEAWIDEVVSSEEVDASKPAPDIFELATRRAGVGPDRAIVIGDTVWDIKAAAAADLRCVAVLSGGLARCELLEAGAAAVYDDVADLTAHLDDSPLADLLGTS